MIIKLKRLHLVGESYRDFRVTRVLEIEELQCVLRELVHEPSGAQVLHIANDDQENLFSLSFKTLPDNSKGVAHILEHTVLCGSAKYPVKDPFFAMSRRSLNTFMNALTGSDFTCYPAASQVPKDFYNLLAVYLDAVFHPNLNRLSFLQEGHRLEFANPEDPDSPLVHKGIVFNEMKGALTSPSTRLIDAMHHLLYPNITYGHNAGGDPKEIPLLTYEELLRFHAEYYHPSHCLFFFYGNMPLEDHLDFIAHHALDGVIKAAPLKEIGEQSRFTIPKKLALEYPISLEEYSIDQTLICFGWLTCNILQQDETLALSILEIILMDTDASPLKMALLRSGLCKQASASIDVEASEIPCLLILRGCLPENADRLESLIFETLQTLSKTGIPIQHIERAMHQLEFFRSEITGNHAPFGLSLFMRSALLKQHGGDPASGLMIHSLFARLRKRLLEEPRYFSTLIDKYFLNNKHFVRMIMTPNPDLTQKELEEEQAVLRKIKEQLSQKQREEILKQSYELEEFQKRQEVEDINVLPKISLDDVPSSSRFLSLTEEKIGSLTIFHHACFTNEITYADLVYDLPLVTEKELGFVRLFTIMLPQMGFGKRSYAEALEYIQENTGGVNLFLAFNQQVHNPNHFSPIIAIRGKALRRKTDKLFPLFGEMVSFVDFSDLTRLKEVLLKHYTTLQSAFNQNAMRYAISLAASGQQLPSMIGNEWYGVNYYRLIKNLVEEIDNQLPWISEKLQELHQRLLGLEQPHLILSCDAQTYDELKRHRFYGLENLPTKPFPKWYDNYLLDKVTHLAVPIASPVAFVCQLFKSEAYVHPATPAIAIAAGLFDNLVLHQSIREQGGAYGGGAVNNTLSGLFYFYSYRDPNISRSLSAFEQAIQLIMDGHFQEGDLEEAKLEIIQGLDAPIAPGSRADLAYSWLREGKTQEVRQSFRNRLLACTRDEVISTVRDYLMPRQSHATTVVFAGKELIEKENSILLEQNQPPLNIQSF